MTISPPALTTRAEREASRTAALLRRLIRWAFVGLGLAVMAAGVLLAPLPGPMGLPVIAVGVMIVLRNSYRAKKQFVRLEHAYPRILYPVRRLLRRDPQIAPVFWQQTLRIEKLLLPKGWRFAARIRRNRARRSKRPS